MWGLNHTTGVDFVFVRTPALLSMTVATSHRMSNLSKSLPPSTSPSAWIDNAILTGVRFHCSLDLHFPDDELCVSDSGQSYFFFWKVPTQIICLFWVDFCCYIFEFLIYLRIEHLSGGLLSGTPPFLCVVPCASAYFPVHCCLTVCFCFYSPCLGGYEKFIDYAVVLKCFPYFVPQSFIALGLS